MSKAGIIVILGLLIAFLPFLGFPTGLKTTLYIVFGLAIIVLGFLVRQERNWLLEIMQGGAKTDTYTENAPKRSSFTE